MADIIGPPIVPAGILNALNSFEAHMQNGPPIIPGNPIDAIPGNPIFVEEGTGVLIVGALFGLHDTSFG
jgi:hypothetical protein